MCTLTAATFVCSRGLPRQCRGRPRRQHDLKFYSTHTTKLQGVTQSQYSGVLSCCHPISMQSCDDIVHKLLAGVQLESICDACDDQSSDEQQQRSSLRHRDRFLAKLQQLPVDRAATTLLPGQQRSKALPRQSSSRPCTQQSAARDPIVSAASSRFDQPSPRRSTQLGGCGHGGASARTEAHHPVCTQVSPAPATHSHAGSSTSCARQSA